MMFRQMGFHRLEQLALIILRRGAPRYFDDTRVRYNVGSSSSTVQKMLRRFGGRYLRADHLLVRPGYRDACHPGR